MTWRPSAHAFLGLRACLTVFPQSQLKRFLPYLCENCISLKCRTEALQCLIVCFRWDPQRGCQSSMLPTVILPWGLPGPRCSLRPGGCVPANAALSEGLETHHWNTTLANVFASCCILWEIFVFVLLERNPAISD